MSFFDHSASIFSSSVHPSVCPSVCLFDCKLFIFLCSSPEPLGQFHPNLKQDILKLVQMNDVSRLFPRGETYKIAIIHWRNFKNLILQNHSANFDQTWHKAFFVKGEGSSSLFKWRITPLSKGRWLWNSIIPLTKCRNLLQQNH